jgi:hypothetical protein
MWKSLFGRPLRRGAAYMACGTGLVPTKFSQLSSFSAAAASSGKRSLR